MKSEELYSRDEKIIADCMKIRLFPITMKKAYGATITDVDDQEYVDFSANWAVANTGYSHPKVLDAVNKQMSLSSFASPASVVTEPTVALAEKLAELAPGSFEKKVWFGLSGSDANDCVAKLVPLATGRPRLISFFGAYHGQTMGSLSLSGHTAQAKFIGSGNVVKIPYPYCYRCVFDKTPESCNFTCLDFLENAVFTSVSPPEDTGAIIVEAIQCDGGDVPPPDDYMKKLKQICEKYGIYFIVDEVKIGIGRTGKMFGIENYDVEPDAIIFGKPIASGFPLSGVVGRKNILDSVVAGHLFTTGGNPVSAAAGLATLDIIEEEMLMKKAEEMGNYMIERLLEMQKRVALIGDVRGKGLVIGVELVTDREKRTPGGQETAMVCYQAYKKGLIIFYVGLHSNVLEITPPLVISKDEVDHGLNILEGALTDVQNGKISKEEIARFAGW